MLILAILHTQSSKMNNFDQRFIKNAENEPLLPGKSGFFVNTVDSLA